ncbi:class I SAM-dependent methyltransferase [Actinoplanes sp. NPDC026619]|uniref:class I SAM-dependent methyltransferase n=1 Tax=Actinoplanes sp. NPDC026619 TaxID=3155798 RepID=UPI003407438F
MDQLTEQREYYRHRAGEYDQWWQRQGRYALDEQAREHWFADIDEAAQTLDRFRPEGDVLEFAAGTGWWTERLTRHATRVTAVDAHTETLELNRARTGGTGKVTYVQADIFDWSPPPAAFDTVFFSYWLSHVPADRLDGFWQQVATALRPGGRVFLLDSYRPERIEGDLQERVLNDGRTFQVIKRFWQPAELESLPGWRLTAGVTTHGAVIHAHGAPDR